MAEAYDGKAYLDAAWAAFRKLHGSCAACRGDDPYCAQLGLFANPRLGGAVDYDPRLGGAAGAVSRLRMALIHGRAAQPMTDEVKAKLRIKGAEHKVGKLCPGDVFTLDGHGYQMESSNGTVRCWRWETPGAEPTEVALAAADLAAALACGRAKIVRRRK
jgi:hypothetical protein